MHCSLGMAVNEANVNLSMNLFLTAFYIYAFMIHAFYDCNLRAYLMKSDFEPVVDNAKDIYDQVHFNYSPTLM